MNTKKRSIAMNSNCFFPALIVLWKHTKCSKGGITIEIVVNKQPPSEVKYSQRPGKVSE